MKKLRPVVPDGTPSRRLSLETAREKMTKEVRILRHVEILISGTSVTDQRPPTTNGEEDDRERNERRDVTQIGCGTCELLGP